MRSLPGCSLRAGTAKTPFLKPPLLWTPMTCTLGQQFCDPFCEVGDVGSLTYGSSEHLSPGFTLETASATAMTSNPSSWPGVRG